MTATLIGDVHIGRKFKSKDIPLDVKGLREQVLLAQFKRKIVEAINSYKQDPNHSGVIILGDLFDSFCVGYDDLINAYNILKLLIDNEVPCDIIAGNHDISKDKERISALEILRMMTLGSSLNYVIEKPLVYQEGKEILVPYMTDEDLRRNLIIRTYWGQGFTIIGHFEEASFPWLKQGFSKVFSGHIHLPRVEDNLVVVGSIMPLTFAEDATNTFMKTCTLEEYEQDLAMGVSMGRCYRLKLKDGEELPANPKCLQMSKYVEKKEKIENAELNVDFEPFDIEKLMHEALDNLGLFDEMYNQYLNNRMAEVENV